MSWWDSSLPSYIWESASSKTAKYSTKLICYSHFYQFLSMPSPRLLVLYPKNTSTTSSSDRLANKPHELIGCQSQYAEHEMCQYFGISPDLNHPATKFVLEPSIHTHSLSDRWSLTMYLAFRVYNFVFGACLIIEYWLLTIIRAQYDNFLESLKDEIHFNRSQNAVGTFELVHNV